MKLIFLGTGGAFTMSNWHSNMLLDVEGQKLLIDCGSDIRFSLAEAKIDVRSIDGIYISHCHADHAGGLEYIGFKRFLSDRQRPFLYGHPKVIDTLWSNTLKGGMAIMTRKYRTLNDYFSVVSGNFLFGRKVAFSSPVFCEMVRTIHMQDEIETMPSFGLMISCLDTKKIFITTDTRFDLINLRPLYEKASVIFQDCETYDLTGEKRSGVHAHIVELNTLPPEIKAKMWLYHYNDGPLPDAKSLGYAGFVQKGQSFDFK